LVLITFKPGVSFTNIYFYHFFLGMYRWEVFFLV